MEHILRGVLGPFLENTDLLRAMFVDGHASTDAAPAAGGVTATRRPAARAGGIREGDTCGGGEWSPPPSTNPPASSGRAPAEDSGDSREDGRAAGGISSSNSSSSSAWGYRSSVSSKGCWKVDAWAAARRDGSVDLSFDSIAFEIFVRPEDGRWGKGGAEEEEGTSAATAVAAAGKRSSSSPATVVTNVLPFRLVDGLPRELGLLLFDKKLVASLLAEDDADHQPPSRDSARRRQGKEAGSAEPGGADSSPGETPEEGETGKTLWVRKKASNSTGPVLSHVHHADAVEGVGKVEVRIRGEPLDAEALAMAGLPQDMAALVVAADVDPSTAGPSKLPASAAAGASGGDKQGRRKQRAAAH